MDEELRKIFLEMSLDENIFLIKELRKIIDDEKLLINILNIVLNVCPFCHDYDNFENPCQCRNDE